MQLKNNIENVECIDDENINILNNENNIIEENKKLKKQIEELQKQVQNNNIINIDDNIKVEDIVITKLDLFEDMHLKLKKNINENIKKVDNNFPQQLIDTKTIEQTFTLFIDD